MAIISDLKFKDRQTLADDRGNLTSPSLDRISDATYIDKNGILQTSWGVRDQLIATAAQNDITNGWWNDYQAGNSTANAIVPDANSGTHGIDGDDGITSPGVTYIFSIEAKKGLQN